MEVGGNGCLVTRIGVDAAGKRGRFSARTSAPTEPVAGRQGLSGAQSETVPRFTTGARGGGVQEHVVERGIEVDGKPAAHHQPGLTELGVYAKPMRGWKFFQFCGTEGKVR